MKFRALILISILFAFALSSHAQSSSTFTSADGGFSIALPDDGFAVQDTPEEEAGLGYGKRYTWKIDGDKVFIVTYYVASNKPMDPPSKNALLQGFVPGFKTGMEKKGFKVTQKPYLFKGHKGAEFRFTASNTVSVTRFFVTATRVYLLQVTMKAPTAEAEILGVKKLDSLKLLTKPEIIAAKLADADPEDLPQSPATERVSTDTRDNGLKGTVQSVVEETSDPTPRAVRRKVSESYYDRRGLLTKKLDYTDGYPTAVSKYGFIDGMRVLSTETIGIENDLSPNSSPTKIVTMMQSPIGPPTDIPSTTESAEMPEEDGRYLDSIVYKYDSEKRLISELYFTNSGIIGNEFIWEYSAGSRKRILKEFDGVIAETEVQKLDATGNVTEITTLDTETGKPLNTLYYTYEFDANGNWTIRRATEKVTVRGKMTVKAVSTDYRTIVYYK